MTSWITRLTRLPYMYNIPIICIILLLIIVTHDTIDSSTVYHLPYISNKLENTPWKQITTFCGFLFAYDLLVSWFSGIWQPNFYREFVSHKLAVYSLKRRESTAFYFSFFNHLLFPCFTSYWRVYFFHNFSNLHRFTSFIFAASFYHDFFWPWRWFPSF